VTIWEWLDRVGERRARVMIDRPANVRLLANVIGCSLVFGFLGAIMVLVWLPVPEANKDLLTYMLGQLSGFAGGVVAYHYTMTAGARELDAKRAETNGKAIDGLKSAIEGITAATGNHTPDVTLQPGETAQADPAAGGGADRQTKG